MSQNRSEKQIRPFKTVNWLFNGIWYYLVIGCFNWKFVVFQQTVVRVYYILNINQGAFYTWSCWITILRIYQKHKEKNRSCSKAYLGRLLITFCFKRRRTISLKNVDVWRDRLHLNEILVETVVNLTHFGPIFHFYTPLKTKGFLAVSGIWKWIRLKWANRRS